MGEEEEGTINNGRKERKKIDNFGLRRLTRIAFQTTDPSFLFLVALQKIAVILFPSTWSMPKTTNTQRPPGG